MSKTVRYGVLVAAVAVAMAIFGADAALAFDDGKEAPFAVGTEVSKTFGESGVVLANIDGKSYVWDPGTNKCWAFQRRSVSDAGYSTTAILPIENVTGVCDRYKPRPEPEPAPRQSCEWVQATAGYAYRMPVIETGGFAYGAVPATSRAVCTTVSSAGQ